jgi:hypothetical protein
VDIDLKSFFDEVNHCLLLQLLYRKVKCPLTLRLIRKWMRAPIDINGKLVKRRKGVPQGSPLSPLLSNIMLNELDKEMEKQGLRYVRYADDFSIYTKSEHTARKIGNSIYLFLKDKLKLPINREKSGIRKPMNFTILGYSFVPTYVKGEKGKYQLVVSDKSWKSWDSNQYCNHPVPSTSVSKTQRDFSRMAQLLPNGKYTSQIKRTRWMATQSFKVLQMALLEEARTEEEESHPTRRRAPDGISMEQIANGRMGNCSKSDTGYDHNVEASIKRGYEPLLLYYEKVAPHLNEPLYTRPVRTVV